MQTLPVTLSFPSTSSVVLHSPFRCAHLNDAVLHSFFSLSNIMLLFCGYRRWRSLPGLTTRAHLFSTAFSHLSALSLSFSFPVLHSSATRCCARLPARLIISSRGLMDKHVPGVIMPICCLIVRYRGTRGHRRQNRFDLHRFEIYLRLNNGFVCYL